MSINLPSSKPQANVASHLEELRKVYLHDALANAIKSVELVRINKELDSLAPPRDLKNLASRGIRGEFVFALPTIIATKPNLLGYYRLLLGFSQKEFYQKSRLARFQPLEVKGQLSSPLRSELKVLCQALVERASEMINLIGFDKISTKLLEELTLLTLGPQLRGGLNTRIGRIANRAVFEIIQEIVAPSIIQATESRLELTNASARKVMIEFSADPDISIFEELSGDKLKKLAIEIKGGTDKSNIWNRLGEAEKSHQSAKQRGFVEFWTIYNVPDLNISKAREKSPTTNRFYSLIDLASKATQQFQDFHDRLISLVGIADKLTR